MNTILKSIFLSFCVFQVSAQTILEVPGRDLPAKIDVNGYSVLPSGRLVKPAGKTLRINSDPFGMAVSPDGKWAVTLHNGAFTRINLEKQVSKRFPPYGTPSKLSPYGKSTYLGIVFSPNSEWIYLSGGDSGNVLVVELSTGKILNTFSLNGTFKGYDFDDSFTSDLVLLPEQNELLVLDRANFRMVRMKADSGEIVAVVPTGRQPFGISLSPDHQNAFVANVGMYSYPLVEGTNLANLQKQYIPWHPYANDTKESREGTEIMGKKIPGVGDPRSDEAMSIFQINLSNNQITKKYKPGFQLGEMVEEMEVVGGSSPNSLAVSSKFAYVSNATNDNIAVLDYATKQIKSHIPIKLNAVLDKRRGYLPFGLCLSKDEKTLYVTLLGLNAVAVIDIPSQKTKGFIPTGWGPTRVRLSADEKTLYVTTCRGYGAGPNGGKDFKAPEQGSYVGDIQLGTFQTIDMPNEAQLAAYTQEVKNNTYQEYSAKGRGNKILSLDKNKQAQSPIKHIVYITKENRTYDEIFGQFKGANGDSTIARYGLNQTVVLPDSLKTTFHNVNVMPNHSLLAKRFAMSDNFYCDSDASIHGHHWMVGVIPNEWVEANSSVSKSAKIFSKAPGRRHPGTTGSIDPEDYAEVGGLWEALERKNISFYNFGEANETAHTREEWFDTLTGAGHVVMVPMQKALWKNTSHNYAGFNMDIPDMFRAEQFESEFTKMWLTGKKKMPSVVTIQLPNDHGSDPRPEDGYVSNHSFMADNDLALARMINFLSTTPYWKNMLVIVTEDDPQGGVDHVDAHRSVLMMAGPYVKRNYVSHKHANFGSLLRLIYTNFGVPSVNHYDQTATLLDDFFTDKPDFGPVDFVFPDRRIFQPEVTMKKYNKTIDWKKIKKRVEMDNVEQMRKEHYKSLGDR
ncbi:bifunctional YncE family protein/alkaline phosphatase family protein [Aquirufa ecclesiirivi]|uniref:Bifunctional YncE family protein/alkaline phosphatase family protein n=1 Tax=Aquirufa ecclesiirivi TaxID=2715124 RepID=A0ABT4JDV7_9BACT|nr:bifunctional YncE family protein/alkaline phosphatase family protein [Aquirufa ecclesiirivi]MCZ2474418.1 bifunctional YncE family protein/alkaline phosphatase family protein [Aquirufa ecclesiirivi]